MPEDKSLRRDMALMKVALDQAFSYTEYELSPRREKLRSSILPYCPLAEWHRLANDPDQRPHLIDGTLYDYRSVELAGSLYMEMGNTVHEILQNWIVKSNDKLRVLAKWNNNSLADCVGKGCPLTGKTVELNNKGCKKCGAFPRHEEITVDGKSTGAIDQTWVLGLGMDVYIVDIKTTSLGKVYTHQASLKPPAPPKKGQKPKKVTPSPYPNPPYIWQTDAYAVRFVKRLKKMGYKLRGTTILYVPRDNPRQAVFVPIRHKPKKKWLAKFEARLDRIADGWSNMTQALKRNDLGRETAEHAKAHKLCSSLKEYERDVEECFDCPLWEVCFDEKKLNKTIDKTLKVWNRNKDVKPKVPTASSFTAPAKLRKWDNGISL